MTINPLINKSNCTLLHRSSGLADEVHPSVTPSADMVNFDTSMD